MAGIGHEDGGAPHDLEPARGGRLLTDFDRLEEYSAAHGESFDSLGNWPADRFETAWASHRIRIEIDRIEEDRRGMVRALYSNGMIGGDDLKKEVTSINTHCDEARVSVLKLYGVSDHEEEEQEEEQDFSFAPPLLAKVSEGVS